MSGSNDKDAEQLSHLDDFMIAEILAGDPEDADESAAELVSRCVQGAEIALRKGRLVSLRAEIDRERSNPRPLVVDAERMRKRLRAAANDPEVKMTLAARNALDDGGDGDISSLLEDLAEIERDTDGEGG